MEAQHATFIMLAYAASLIAVGGLIAWIMLEHRSLQRTLADFEQRGVTRRSDERARILS